MRLGVFLILIVASLVSIHAPREGCDRSYTATQTKRRSFNSRTPGGVRPRHLRRRGALRSVSIHAPREGCDTRRTTSVRRRRACFNSRTPGGVRRPSSSQAPAAGCFNSRTPGGVRRPHSKESFCSDSVSIHAPREGCDFRDQSLLHSRRYVSIHAPREGCD